MDTDDRSSTLEALVDACLAELAAVSPAARDAGESLLAAAVELHRPALVVLVDALRECAGDAAVERAASDPMVGDVLALHDLHPADVTTRVDGSLHDALTELGGGAPVGGALLGVHDGIARISVADAEHRGCNGSTRGEQIEAALLARVPELDRVDVVGVPMLSLPDEPTEVPLPLPKLRASPGARSGALPRTDTAEGCELCGEPLGADHGHGVDVEAHRLICLCDPCRIVLGANQEGHGRFRSLPRRVIADPTFASTDGEWEALGIPVSTAFFFHDSVAGGIVAFYPSPAGATESLLGARDWEALAATSAVARDLVPDTEAMLLRHTSETHESYLVPVDRCYELVGLVRAHWRGFDGGQDAHDALDEFFSRVRADAVLATPEVVGSG